MDNQTNKCDNIPCKECMEGAPYKCCCLLECGQHEFCKNCSWQSGK